MASNERPARATGSRRAEASPVGAPRGQRGPARGGAVSSRRCAAAGGGRALGPCGRSRPRPALPGAGARPPQLLPRRAPTPARPAPDPGRATLVLPRAFTNEGRNARPLHLHQMSKKAVIHKPGGSCLTSTGNESASTLILDFPDPRTERK